MPLKLNVGLSRKVGERNYGSRGASVDIEVELGSALVKNTGKLQERIRQLFALVRVSLSEELDGAGQHQAGASVNGTAAHASKNQPGPAAERPATQAQVKALASIAQRQNLSLNELLQDRFHADKLEDLSLRHASQLIDELRKGGGS
jgi:hypothetical protein